MASGGLLEVERLFHDLDEQEAVSLSYAAEFRVELRADASGELQCAGRSGAGHVRRGAARTCRCPPRLYWSALALEG